MLLLANLYSRTGRDGEVDSLCQYALKTSEPAVKARIYYFLYEENVAKKEYEDAVTYLSHYVLLSDTFIDSIIIIYFCLKHRIDQRYHIQ